MMALLKIINNLVDVLILVYQQLEIIVI